VPNLQFWFADVAFVLQADWDALPPDEYPVYAPALVIEVLSPSNTPAKVNRQLIVAMSSGTQEFWVVDAANRTVQVTEFSGTKTYAAGDAIRLTLFGGASIAVDQMFAV
jgi:Uma2 family endonuclease